MKGLIPNLFFLVFTTLMFSQNASIEGFLVDSNTQPVEDATIKLIALNAKNSDSKNIGTISDINGYFILNNLELGKYMIEISHINYEPYLKELIIKEDKLIVLKSIILFRNLNTLNEVIISGKKLPITQNTDKITINVSKNILASGGTATDVLKQIAAVTVSTEGNISIRGKNDIDVLIDGKPSGIVAAQGQNFLNQLDLSSVEKIEIIMNPSVVKSVTGAGGVINIIMKKNSDKGLSGNFNTGYGSDEWYHISPEINYNTGVFNLFMNYTFRHRKRLSNNSNTRNQIIDIGQQSIDQKQTGERIDKRHNIEFGMDYFLNENQYITMSANYRSRDKEDNQIRMTTSTINNNVSDIRSGLIREPETNEGWGLTAQYRSNTSNKKALSILLNYVHSVEDEIILREELVSTEFTELIEGIQTFYVDTNDRYLLDVENKIGFTENSEILFGARGIYRKINQTFNASEYNNDTDNYEDIAGVKDIFNYKDIVASVYSQYNRSLRKWSYESALRLELWNNSYNSRSISQTFENGYFKIFPSFKIGYDFSNSTNAVFSIKKGVNRPSPNRLNPFPNLSNAFNISIGNPELEPEIFYNVETGINFKVNKTSLSSALFFTFYDDMIQRVTELQDDGITITTPININNMLHYGLDLNLQINITKWLSQQFGGLLYIRSFEDDFIEASEKVIYQIKSTTDFELTDFLEVQVFGSYHAPENTPQGEIKARYYFDAGAEYKFWKNNARLSIVVTDIFNNLIEKKTLIDENLNIFNSSKINTRRVYFTFRYKF